MHKNIPAWQMPDPEKTCGPIIDLDQPLFDPAFALYRRRRSSPNLQTKVGRMIDDFLNYFALGLLLFIIVMMFYAIIAIHDIPARIAESRHHPHADAIHAAGWVSLFTLHVLWPFLWIWAMAYRPERGWGFSSPRGEPATENDVKELQRRLVEVEAALKVKTGI
jgi:hypothetical protein